MSENDSKVEWKKPKFEPSIIQCTTVDGQNIKCVSLASHEMVPSKFEDWFEPNSKPAKQLLKEYAVKQANTMIAKGREKHGKSAPTEIISALGSEEEIYSIADCGMFATIFTAYSRHYKL